MAIESLDNSVSLLSPGGFCGRFRLRQHRGGSAFRTGAPKMGPLWNPTEWWKFTGNFMDNSRNWWRLTRSNPRISRNSWDLCCDCLAFACRCHSYPPNCWITGNRGIYINHRGSKREGCGGSINHAPFIWASLKMDENGLYPQRALFSYGNCYCIIFRETGLVFWVILCRRAYVNQTLLKHTKTNLP